MDLHGRLDRVVCLACGELSPRAAAAGPPRRGEPGFAEGHGARVLPDGDVAVEDTAAFRLVGCRSCGGALKPDVVVLRRERAAPRVERCKPYVEEAEALVVLGSSLHVFSGAPVRQAGACPRHPDRDRQPGRDPGLTRCARSRSTRAAPRRSATWSPPSRTPPLRPPAESSARPRPAPGEQHPRDAEEAAGEGQCRRHLVEHRPGHQRGEERHQEVVIANVPASAWDSAYAQVVKATAEGTTPEVEDPAEVGGARVLHDRAELVPPTAGRRPRRRRSTRTSSAAR